MRYSISPTMPRDIKFHGGRGGTSSERLRVEGSISFLETQSGRVTGEIRLEKQAERSRTPLRNVLPISFAMLATPQTPLNAYASFLEAALTDSSITIEYESEKGTSARSYYQSYKIATPLGVITAADRALFPEIARAIDNTKSVLAMAHNWDDADGKPVSESTWQRASNFLLAQARHAYRTLSLKMPVPVISPVGDGSIDLHWKPRTTSCW
jgi:hypothetical protein